MLKKRWMIASLVLIGVLLFWMRGWIGQAAGQLLWGMLTAVAALPAARWLEKRMPAGAAAALSLFALAAGAAALMMLLVPPLITQAKELSALLPALRAKTETALQYAHNWMEGHNLRLNPGMQNAVLLKSQEVLTTAASSLALRLGNAAGNLSKWFLTPVLAFYFLRDRLQIGQWLKSLLPLAYREPAVWVVREVRRETAGYLRGQLLVSAAVGAATAVGLLLCGIPSWLALGALMGVLEMIPYLGPVAGSTAVALFALPYGAERTLWALAVVLLVQQLEGSLLSPRLVSGATRLHPLTVVLCVMIGGAAAGVMGVLFSVPLALCVRAVFRVVSLLRVERQRI
ncbi:MAG: AI-2E family transporter [Clostridia bacterium]|nr:AI-2E family transporter [Clostridia bacterium]